MFGELPWWVFATMAALSAFSFGLGASWMYRWQLWKRRSQQPLAAPPPAQTLLEERVVGTVESLQRQMEELAERQDFAERLLAERRAALPAKREKVNTPV